VNNLKETVKGDDASAIRRAIDALGDASSELGKTLYEEAAKKQGASRGTENKPTEGEVKRKDGDDVIDAEFEAKDK
jgi:molecular chaperone DnaK